MSKPNWMGVRPPTEAEKQKYYGCAYCCAIGACPKCHGRAEISRLRASRDRLRKAASRIADYIQGPDGEELRAAIKDAEEKP